MNFEVSVTYSGSLQYHIVLKKEDTEYRAGETISARAFLYGYSVRDGENL